MSHTPLAGCGRTPPRWSRLLTGAPAQTTLSPASMAGLPGLRAIVCVGPPLSLSAPRLGSAKRSKCGDPWAKAQVNCGMTEGGLYSRLYRSSVIVPAQLPPVGLLARIVFAVLSFVPPLFA